MFIETSVARVRGSLERTMVGAHAGDEGLLTATDSEDFAARLIFHKEERVTSQFFRTWPEDLLLRVQQDPPLPMENHHYGRQCTRYGSAPCLLMCTGHAYETHTRRMLIISSRCH